ncbi:hypothetical protein NC651_007286 [Populus alba x Populus x berolinensis]|nr:hypothetical protein NC651_007286 [Populus alba x Populus x berolinensis]
MYKKPYITRSKAAAIRQSKAPAAAFQYHHRPDDPTLLCRCSKVLWFLFFVLCCGLLSWCSSGCWLFLVLFAFGSALRIFLANSCWLQLLFWFCLCLIWHWFELSLPRSLPGVSLHEGCSCYCRFWGACSPVQIVLLCIYSVLCWPPTVLQACLALFDLIYFLHSIKKKKETK